MALIKCTECGAEIGDKAKQCPKCGCPMDLIRITCDHERQKQENGSSNEKKGELYVSKKKGCVISLIFLMIIFIIGFIVTSFFEGNSEESLEQTEEMNIQSDDSVADDEEQIVSEYGVEQMVGYDSLVALPEGSPVIVNGVVDEISSGIYVMEIFVEDIDNVDMNNPEKKSIYIFDLDPQVSYDKRYISVEGHTKLSDDMPIVIAENITDASETYIESGGILPE